MSRSSQLAGALLLWFAAVAVTAVVPPAAAQPAKSKAAKAKAEVEAKSKAAMASYDALDFDAAKQQLLDALALAKKHDLGADPVVAKVQLNLGVLYFTGLKDEEAAIAAFAEAAKLDPTITIDVAYRTDQMAALLAEVKKQGGAMTAGEGGCAGAELQHEAVESAPTGAAIPIAALVGRGLGADEVALYYRAPGSSTYTRVRLEPSEGCAYAGAIPATAVKGGALHYYVAAYKGGELAASRGSSGSPNVVTLGAGGDDENPLGGEVTEEGDEPSDGRRRVFVSVALGSGAGYVTGQTEVSESDVACCFAPALLHLMPEIGYYFTRRTSASLAVRLGFAIGANIEGHATAAPAGLLRLRHALASSGEGIAVSGLVGAGIIRHVVVVENAPDGMNKDTTASGPFLIGAGLAYLKSLSSSLDLVFELDGIAAVPGGIEELGTCPGAGCVKPSFGFQFDLDVGLSLAF
jgi:hypothetical protein